MTKLKEVYKCEICGNIVEVLHNGFGELVCCNKTMKLQLEKNVDQGNEKHVPIIEEINGMTKIRIGSVEHPMEEKHFIEWVEISTEKGYSKKFLSPGEKPNALFLTKAKNIKARAYCNVHGLWTTKR